MSIFRLTMCLAGSNEHRIGCLASSLLSLLVTCATKERSMQMSKKIVLFMLVIMCLPLSCALAQVSGSISGRVGDTSGAAVPDAMVIVSNAETGASHAVTTDEAGNYRVLSLPVGRYEVRTEKPGFQTVVRRGISLAVAQDAVVDMQMPVGEITQQVTVTAEIPVVNTTTSQISGLVA